jgi:pilus assembly protein Flp/PilA
MELFLPLQGTWLWMRARVRFSGERGASAVEYGVLAALICAAVVAAVFFLGQSTSQKFDCTKNSIATQSAQC